MYKSAPGPRREAPAEKRADTPGGVGDYASSRQRTFSSARAASRRSRRSSTLAVARPAGRHCGRPQPRLPSWRIKAFSGFLPLRPSPSTMRRPSRNPGSCQAAKIAGGLQIDLMNQVERHRVG